MLSDSMQAIAIADFVNSHLCAKLTEKAFDQKRIRQTSQLEYIFPRQVCRCYPGLHILKEVRFADDSDKEPGAPARRPALISVTDCLHSRRVARH